MKRCSLLVCLLMFGSLFTVVQAQTTYRWVDKDGKVNYSDQPAPPDAKNVQQRMLGSGSYVETSGPSYNAKKATQNFPVTLFTSADCGIECKVAREFLNRRSIPFSEKLIRTVSDSVTFKKATGIDELVVPTLLVGAQAQKGYEKNSWNKLLDAAGYPHESTATSATRPDASNATGLPH
jgi:hypothetical protein